jgi:hypothetical protein
VLLELVKIAIVAVSTAIERLETSIIVDLLELEVCAWLKEVL